MKPAFLTYNRNDGSFFLCEAGRCKVSDVVSEDRRETVERMCEELGESKHGRWILRHDAVKDQKLFESLIRRVVTVADDAFDVEFICRAMGTGSAPQSIRAKILDDQPREIYQPGMGLIKERYTLSGVTVRNRKSTPLVDKEDDDISVNDVLGSVRNVTVDRGALLGDIRFANDKASQDAYRKYVDGHLKEFKAVLRRLKREQKADGTHVISESELILVRLGIV